MSGSNATKVACPVCGVRMPEAEVDVHLDLCLYEQTEREEVAEAQRQRQQPPRRGTVSSLPTSTSAESAEKRSRASSDRKDRQHSPSPVPPPSAAAAAAAAAATASPFASFPAAPTHAPLGSSSAFPLPQQPPSLLQQRQQTAPPSSGGPYVRFPGLPPHHQPPSLLPLTAAASGAPYPPQQQQPGQPVQFVVNGTGAGSPSTGPPPMFYYPATQAAPQSGGFPPTGYQVAGPAPPGSTAGPRQPQPYQPFSIPPTTAQNVQPFSPFAHPPTQQPQPFQPPATSPQQVLPLSQQQQQPSQHRFPAAYFTPQALPHAQPVQFQPQQQQQQMQAQYPAQQYYAVPQQLSPQYQAFLQRYQSLQQNQSFSQFPQILQKTPSQQSLLRPAVSLPPESAASVAAEREKAQARLQQEREREQEKPVYFEYCEGWLFVCERPSVRFLKSWVVLKEASLHLSDTATARVRLVIPLASVKAFLVDAQKNTGKKYSFGLQCKDDRIYYLATRSAEELLPWLQGVRKELRRMAETSPSAVKEIVPTAGPTNTTPDTKKAKERSKREESKPREKKKKSTPEKSKEGKTKDRNGTFSGLFAKLSSIAAGSGDDKAYKALDEEFLKQMKESGGEEGKAPTQQQLDSQKVQIFSHMNKVFSLYAHPLGKLVIDFTDEFVRHKDRILSARPSTALAKVTQEIQTFLDRLLVTVEHYYGGEMAHVEQFVHTARLAAEHCVFSLLYDIVYPVYTKRYLAEDRKFTQKMGEFADITTPDLIDNPKFWLLDDKKGEESRPGSEPYQKAINMMAAITELATPVAKLNCLVDTSRIICGCVNEYWTKRDPTGSEIAVSCDDLLPILLYVIIKSKLATIHTESMYMQDFIGEREQMQIEGYSLATFQAASAALLCLERDSLRKEARPDETATPAPAVAPGGGSSSSSPPLVPSPQSSSAAQAHAGDVASASATASPAASTAAGDGAQSRAHRARRASWISSVLAQQAAVPLQPVVGHAADVGEEEEEESDDDWTFFKGAATGSTPPAAPALLCRPSSAEEEDFIDSFRPPPASQVSNTSSGRPVNLLIDWGDGSDDSAKQPDARTAEEGTTRDGEGVEELGSDDPTTSDGEENEGHPTKAEAEEALPTNTSTPVSVP